MSDQSYTPEEIQALRDTIKIVRSTKPAPEVLAVVERVEREIEEQRNHPRAARKRPTKRATRRPQAAAG